MTEEIAVLDGLFGLGAADGRIGRTPASGQEYARRRTHNYETRRNVIDASEGANYSGGSSYAPRLPLLPSTIGLADADLMKKATTGVLPPRGHVIDPSGGANYSGGSSHASGMPLVVSGDPGLAAMMRPESYDDFAQLDPSVPMIKGGYGKAGLGAVTYAPGGGSGYGKAGMGCVGCAPTSRASLGAGHSKGHSPYAGIGLAELDAAFGSTMEIEDGRIGKRPASGREYASRVSHNFETRSNVIDASEGANYSGGSSYAPRLPLLPSTVGLAGLGESYDDFDGLSELSMADGLDELSDLAFFSKLYKPKRGLFARVAGKAKLRSLFGQVGKIRRGFSRMNPMQQARAKVKLRLLGKRIGKVRHIRRSVLKRSPFRQAPPQRSPAYWARKRVLQVRMRARAA